MSTQPYSAQEASGVDLPTSKERASRIPTNYYRNRNPMERWKILCALGATVLTVVWLAYGFAADSGVPAPEIIKARYSHAPVCAAHRDIEAKCSKCHVSFPVAGQETAITEANAKCYDCHKELGKAEVTHWSYQKPTSTPSCGACHRDHRGRDVDLKMMTDNYCTGCHQNVEGHVVDKSKLMFPGKENNAVTGFPEKHPEFPSKKKDRGTIRFSHSFHLQPGLYGSAEDVPDPNSRVNYEKYVTAKGLTLDCDACHKQQTVATVDTAKRLTDGFGVLPVEKDRAYYDPIDFEQHCRACHQMPLLIGFKERLKHGHRTIKGERRILHPPEIREEIRRELAKADLDSLKGIVPDIPRPLPGKAPRKLTSEPGDQADDIAKKRLTELRDKLVERNISLLFNDGGSCVKCHYAYDQKTEGGEVFETGELVPLTRDSNRVANAWGKIRYKLTDKAKAEAKYDMAPAIPRIWYRHAQFDHKAHEFMQTGENHLNWCMSCHNDLKNTLIPKATVAETAVEDNATRDGAAEVMMPGIKNCQQCHAAEAKSLPAGTVHRVEQKHLKKAGHSCTECHLYHHGNH